MHSAYLIEAAEGDTLVVREGRVELRRNGGVAASLPLRSAAFLAVRGRAVIDTTSLGRLATEGVCLHLLSGRDGTWRGAVWGAGPRSVGPLLGQVAAHLDRARRAALARRVVDAKLAGLQANIDTWRRMVRRGRAMLAEARAAVEAARARCAGADPPVLLGHEGAAARAYFRALSIVLPAWTRFAGRKRRPPRDPVNAVLSYAYSLLTAEATTVAVRHGFDPRIGFLHELARGRPSLACDLMEPVRPMVDAWAVGLFRRRTLRSADFGRRGDACVLVSGGKMRFWEAFGELREEVRPVLEEWTARLKTELACRGEASGPGAG